VLMDMQMPDMDGIEATKIICKNSLNNQRPKIIAMTASAREADKQACLEAGMDDYVSKPIKIEELVNVLSQLAVSN
ncbi:MAG: response regulator, partial [Crinalium sp.]